MVRSNGGPVEEPGIAVDRANKFAQVRHCDALRPRPDPVLRHRQRSAKVRHAVAVFLSGNRNAEASIEGVFPKPESLAGIAVAKLYGHFDFQVRRSEAVHGGSFDARACAAVKATASPRKIRREKSVINASLGLSFEERAQNGVRREPIPGTNSGARRTLCAFMPLFGPKADSGASLSIDDVRALKSRPKVVRLRTTAVRFRDSS